MNLKLVQSRGKQRCILTEDKSVEGDIRQFHINWDK